MFSNLRPHVSISLDRQQVKFKYLSEDLFFVLKTLKDSVRQTLDVSSITHQPCVAQILTLVQKQR